MSESKLITAAIAVFEELGVETMSSRDLVRAAVERNLVNETKWLHNHMSRQLRASDLFDTSERGAVRYLAAVEPAPSVVEADDVPAEAIGTTNVVATESEVLEVASSEGEEDDGFAVEEFKASP